MIKIILCLIVAFNLANAQYNGIMWDTSYQQPYYSQPNVQHYDFDSQNREAAEEPIVGSPLLPIIPVPKLFPFGVPGLRFSNLNAGRIGSLMYGHSLLGAENPMADEDGKKNEEIQAGTELAIPQQSAEQQHQTYQADPHLAAHQHESNFGKIWIKKWANPEENAEPMNLGQHAPCGQHYHNYHAAAPGYHQLSSPQQMYQQYQQPAYPVYQPQIYQDYQQTPKPVAANRYSSGQQYAAQPTNEPIVQPAGTYEDSSKATADGKGDERTWDWHWGKEISKKKGDKGDKHDKYDKHDKFDKHDKKGGKDYHKVFYKGIYTVPHEHHEHHEHKPYYQYSAPAPPAPAAYQQQTYTYPSQYSNYYNTYRSNSDVQQAMPDSRMNSEQNKI